jgi:O-methyltransferase
MSWKNDQVTDKETAEILRLAKEALLVEGDFVEMGCYKGDTSLLLAEVLRDGSASGGRGGSGGVPVEKDVQKSVKKLWIYDSFEGLPEKSKFDESVLGVDFKGGELFVTKREVKERFLRAGLPVPVIRKGWFSELTEKDVPEKIAFSFLDGDFYESIRDSLRLVAPRMVTNGVLVVHDYSNPALPGVKKAVDEFMSDFEMDMGAEFRVILL